MATFLPLDAVATTCRKPSDPWIPSDEFLADLPRIMRSFAVPGVGIAVVEGGDVVWSRPFGVTNALTLVPIESRTIFEDASLSKPVFAYRVMQLVDQGLITQAETGKTVDLACEQPILGFVEFEEVT